MKLISLNVYGGRFYEPLMEFVKNQAPSTDIFCFQEVLDCTTNTSVGHRFRTNLFGEFTQALPDFQGFFVVENENYDILGNTTIGVSGGTAFFLRKNYVVKNKGGFHISTDKFKAEDDSYVSMEKNLFYVQFKLGGKLLTVCNVHGISEPGHKLDCPERLEQSQKILDFVTKEPGEKIIVGDFNLLPETQSVLMFEQNGFRNLIKEFNITTTRGSLVKKLHPEYGEGPFGWQEYADYAFVTPGVTPISLEVPDLPLSDHLPLILKFSL